MESAVSVGIAGLVFGVHELVCEWVEFVESLFESGFWNSLCVEDDHVRVTMIPSERFGDVKLPFGLCR